MQRPRNASKKKERRSFLQMTEASQQTAVGGRWRSFLPLEISAENDDSEDSPGDHRFQLAAVGN